jgi:hypothetical protein
MSGGRPAGATAGELFAARDYAGVALLGDESRWETFAARAIVGTAAEGIEGLRQFDGPEPRLYEGVARWIAGDARRARQALQRSDHPHAERLLALLSKPKIRLLGFLPWTRRAPHDQLAGGRTDRRIALQNVSFHPDDAGHRVDASLRELYDPSAPPDLVACEMVEWHLLPSDIAAAPCPLLGHTADFDLHVQAVHPWLDLFDELVVTDPTEKRDLERLTGRPVSSFPKVFGVAERLPPVPRGERDIDVFQSGSLVHPYHPDKALLMHELLDLDGARVHFVDGFLQEDEYLALLGRSRTTFTYVRHPGATPTRGLEALSMGCAVVTQEGSVLTLYAGEDEGVLTYGPEPGDLRRALAAALADARRLQPAAARGGALVRRAFAMSRTAAEYLRYLVFRAADPAHAERERPATRPAAKRAVLWKGWPQSGAQHAEHVALRKLHLARLRERLAAGDAAGGLIDAVREMVLEYASVVRSENVHPQNEGFLGQALSLLDKALGLCPRNLALRFIAVRLALHYGDLERMQRGVALARETLSAPAGSWDVDPLDDVVPWDFFNTFFDYRGYFEAACDVLEGARAPAELERLVRAGLSHYVGLVLEDRSALAAAAALAPGFAFYGLEAARATLEDPHAPAAERQSAAERLVEIGRSSILIERARALIVRPSVAPAVADEAREDISRRASRLPSSYHGGFALEEARAVPVPSWPRVPHAGWTPPPRAPFTDDYPRSTEEVIEDYESDGPPPLVSAIVSTWRSERFMQGLLEDLAGQTIADRLEIVVVDSGSPEGERGIVARFRERFPRIRYVRTAGRETSHAAISRGARHARGRYLTLANTDDRHRRDALEVLARVLDARPDIALVHADALVTTRENETFDTATVAGKLETHDFELWRLLGRCNVGPQPMWRRELHERLGELDPSIESAGDWEFWLRLVETEAFLHVPEPLGLYFYSPTSSERRDPERREREVAFIQQRASERRERLLDERRRGMLRAGGLDDPLLVVVRTGADVAPADELVGRLRTRPAARTTFRLRLARLDESTPDGHDGVATSPPLPTLADVLSEGLCWRHRRVVVVADRAPLDGRELEVLVDRSAEERSGALVAGSAGAAPLPHATVLDPRAVLAHVVPRGQDSGPAWLARLAAAASSQRTAKTQAPAP